MERARNLDPTGQYAMIDICKRGKNVGNVVGVMDGNSEDLFKAEEVHQTLVPLIITPPSSRQRIFGFGMSK